VIQYDEAHSNQPHTMDAGDLAPLVAEFNSQLAGLGHLHLTVAGYDASARHFGQWLMLTKVGIAEINEATVERFAHHRCHCPGIRHSKQVSKKYVRRVRRFVGFLAERGIIQRPTPKTADAPHQRVVEFQQWLQQHRGICASTIDRHRRMVVRLLPALGDNPSSWNAALIREAITAETKRASHAHVKTMTQALKGYLRLLGARGLCRPGLCLQFRNGGCRHCRATSEPLMLSG
jgi:integrase/recombinase XerD